MPQQHNQPHPRQMSGSATDHGGTTHGQFKSTPAHTRSPRRISEVQRHARAHTGPTAVAAPRPPLPQAAVASAQYRQMGHARAPSRDAEHAELSTRAMPLREESRCMSSKAIGPAQPTSTAQEETRYTSTPAIGPTPACTERRAARAGQSLAQRNQQPPPTTRVPSRCTKRSTCKGGGGKNGTKVPKSATN